MTPQERFIAALNIAFHPATKEGDILAAIRGAARLLRGETVAGFLRLDAETELQERLAISEAKLEGAVDYCNGLKADIRRLEAELATAKKPAAPPPPEPEPPPRPAAPPPEKFKFSRGEKIWLCGVAALFALYVIGCGLVANTAKLQRAAMQTPPTPLVQTPAVKALLDSETNPAGHLPNGQPAVFRDGKFVPVTPQLYLEPGSPQYNDYADRRGWLETPQTPTPAGIPVCESPMTITPDGCQPARRNRGKGSTRGESP